MEKHDLYDNMPIVKRNGANIIKNAEGIAEPKADIESEKQARGRTLISVADVLENTLGTFYRNGKVRSADEIKAEKDFVAKTSDINMVFLNLWTASKEHEDNLELMGRVNRINSMIGEVQKVVFGFGAKFEGKLDGFGSVKTTAEAVSTIGRNVSKITDLTGIRESKSGATLSAFHEFIGTFHEEDVKAKKNLKRGASQEGSKSKEAASSKTQAESARKALQEQEKQVLEEHTRKRGFYEKMQSIGKTITYATFFATPIGIGAVAFEALRSLAGAEVVAKYAGIAVAVWATTGFAISRFGKYKAKEYTDKIVERNEEYSEKAIENYKKSLEDAKKQSFKYANSGVIRLGTGSSATIVATLAVSHILLTPVYTSIAAGTGIIITAVLALSWSLRAIRESRRAERMVKKIERQEDLMQNAKAAERK